MERGNQSKPQQEYGEERSVVLAEYIKSLNLETCRKGILVNTNNINNNNNNRPELE